MNKKGFTLIELLAVIMVLAIILIIAVPRVLRVIEDSKKESFRISGENLLKGVKDKVVIDSMTEVSTKIYTIENGEFVGESIPISGKMPNEGIIVITKDGGISAVLHNEDYFFVRKLTEDSGKIVEEVPETCFTYTETTTEVSITDYDTSCSKIVIIPKTINNKQVTVIETNAFRYKSIEEVYLPMGIKTIGKWSFIGNKLKEVVIPNSVESILNDAFMYNKIEKVYMPEHVAIGTPVFNNNQLEAPDAFFYKKTLTGEIDKTTLVSYGGKERENIIFPSNIVNLNGYSFLGNHLTNITIPENIKSIGGNAFLSNSLTSITIPSNLTIQTNSISQTFYDAYVTNNSRAGGTYTAPSQNGIWTKQP